MRIVDFIGRHAVETPRKTALLCRDTRISYGELWDLIQSRAADFAHTPGRSLVVRTTQDPDFVITYFAAHVAGKVIVPMGADVSDEILEETRRLVESSPIPEEVADILFTTGTTGKQKGTMISHRAIFADADNLADAQKFSTDNEFIISGPLNHIGSLSKLWPSMMVGASVRILEGIKNMDDFLNAIEMAEGKAATFLVPASIRMVLNFGRERFAKLADKIDFIETGAAPISQSDMEALCKILPNARLYNTYASTETGIICTHDFNDGFCVAGCLGPTMKNSILHIDDDGFISCQGPTLMSGYVGDEETTRKVLHDGTIYTQDKGRFDDAQRLHLSGREGDIINVGGFKVNPVEVEDAAKSFPGVRDCICVAADHPVLGTALRLIYACEDGAAVEKKALGKHLLGKLEKHKVPQFYTQAEKIERTYNGKLNRKAYARRSGEQIETAKLER